MENIKLRGKRPIFNGTWRVLVVPSGCAKYGPKSKPPLVGGFSAHLRFDWPQSDRLTTEYLSRANNKPTTSSDEYYIERCVAIHVSCCPLNDLRRSLEKESGWRPPLLSPHKNGLSETVSLALAKPAKLAKPTWQSALTFSAQNRRYQLSFWHALFQNLFAHNVPQKRIG
jgi:hypothetical protein